MAFLRFWRHFLAGDDPVIAIGFVASLVVAAILHVAGMISWCSLPLAVAVALELSLRRPVRQEG
jgi:hypothetical protein